jgi:hypothetical protein
MINYSGPIESDHRDGIYPQDPMSLFHEQYWPDYTHYNRL